VTSREFHDRVLKRARKADLSVEEALIEPLEAYYRLLARWNAKINLTALPLRELADEAVDRLLIEPLAAARFVPDATVRWFDLGSGGGSPAVPLKLARPAAQLTMIEAKARKAAFLREAVRTLGLDGASVENDRFEAVAARPEMQGAAAVLTVRAVRIDARLIRTAQSLLSAAGSLLVFSSRQASGAGISATFSHVQALKLIPAGSSTLTIFRRVA
jgi:16S rRNA (guanine527-N7)-methyltransferase